MQKELRKIPKYSHLKRYQSIANSIVRHGFGHFLTQIGLVNILPSVRRARKSENNLLRFSRAQRLRMLLEELGPTFIKFGQLLSTRPDLLPRDILDELSQLQDHVPSFPFPEVNAILESELKQPPEDVYAEFDPQPLAAASIGQVHLARLHSGEDVVVKVRRPNIKEQMETDLDILLEMAKLADKHTHFGRIYRFQDVVVELRRTVQDEIDFLIEAESAEQIGENFRNNPAVAIPKIYWEQTTSAVLTMELLEGTKLTSKEALAVAGHDTRTIINLLVDAMFAQIFRHGIFHADPHPGNLAVSDDGRLIFMDFGIVGKLSGERKRRFILFLLGIINRNSRQLVRSLGDMGVLSRRIDRKALRRDVDRLLDKYLDVPLRKIDLGKSVREIFSLAFEYHIRIPSEFTLLGKTIMTLEGVIEEMDEDVKLIELLQPYTGQLIRQRFSPQALKENFSEQFFETTDFLVSLPRRFNDVLDRVDTEGLPVQLNFPEFDKAFAHMDRLTNRISFSIVLLAFSIIMAGLIIGSGLVVSITGETLLWRLPIIEIGFFLAGIMAVWLLYAIMRSGRL